MAKQTEDPISDAKKKEIKDKIHKEAAPHIAALIETQKIDIAAFRAAEAQHWKVYQHVVDKQIQNTGFDAEDAHLQAEADPVTKKLKNEEIRAHERADTAENNLWVKIKAISARLQGRDKAYATALGGEMISNIHDIAEKLVAQDQHDEQNPNKHLPNRQASRQPHK